MRFKIENKTSVEVSSLNQQELYISLDVGTTTTKVVVGEMIGGDLNIIGACHVPSKGLRKGSVVDIDETIQTIKKAMAQIELIVNIKVANVLLCIGSTGIELAPCFGLISVASADHEISNEDVSRVIDTAGVVSISQDREFLTIIPNRFTVDGVDEIKDPRGMIGLRLEMHGTMITVKKTNFYNIIRCVERANLEVLEPCLQVLGASSLMLSKEERELGSVQIDLGGGSTTISYFLNGMLQSTNVLPFGCDFVTKDLSMVLETSFEEAERIKEKYGRAYVPAADKNQIVDVKILGTQDKHQFTQHEIAVIIEDRMEEIFHYINEEMRQMGIGQTPHSIVFSGGGAMMPGVADLAQEIFSTRVRVYIPDLIGVRKPIYTNAIGTILFAYNYGKLIGQDFHMKQKDSHEVNDEAPLISHMSKKKQEIKVQKPKSEKVALKKIFKYFWD